MKSFDYLLYGVIAFAWSTSWLPLKWQLGIVAPEVSIFWRFLAAGTLMMCFAIWRGENLRLPFAIHIRIAVLSLFLFSCNFTMFYYGGLGVSSGLLAVVFSTASLMVLIIKSSIDREWPEFQLVIAVIFGISGVSLIFLPEFGNGHAPLISLVFCLIGTLIFSLGNILSGRLQSKKISVITANSWGMLYGAAFLAMISLLRGHSFMILPTWKYLGGLAWLSIISTVVAFTCYLTLVGRIGPGRASYITVIFPVMALFISQRAEAYEWTVFSVIGLILVIAGNTIMAKSAPISTPRSAPVQKP
ncbi:MAG: DMT family transporter [Alphaproteobacteria bacterium]|jgi:drug/metabolite transporter (DMT)-like permease|nr:DMT family transporter [Alphaproteobacteria bacterium]MDG2466438.1 DMT family transporter [Alphaproteobacteria bacterium]